MIVSCHSCRQQVEWEGNPYRPFCSRRCQILDLGVWISEGYRIPDEHELPLISEDEGPRSPNSLHK
ncbi:MAG: DNA gyrase inhibitor YacG [Nitrospirota bacterium]|nr:DNA gyrase inhibitor YacG [Nitrospirota bacterium]